MSRTIQPTPESASAQIEAQEEFVWPEIYPSRGYRGFIKRLRLARINKGLSIADMSDEVGLSFRLAYEFENLVAPLPFCHMRVWCDVVGVPFDDFLAIYWADEEAYAVAKEREAEQKVAEQQSLGITSTKAGAPEVPTSNPPHSPRNVGWLSPLRAAFDRILPFFRTRSSTSKKTSE